jgi:hypothetical protein
MRNEQGVDVSDSGIGAVFPWSWSSATGVGTVLRSECTWSVNSTSGKPFKAEAHEAIPTLDWRMYPIRERKSIVARDSQGRVRTEVYVGVIEFHRDTSQEVDLTHLLIQICDPVGLRGITIDQRKKTARVIQLHSPGPMRVDSPRQ